ncbi:MAG: tetratricopeptide repeat protein, partial [Leptolyngbya sp. SIO4C5]|nr:tetratricopeptide repeat protein [Leptolyngbya sp. SIO4C5]
VRSEQYKEAIDSGKKALDLAQNLPDEDLTIIFISNLILSYRGLSDEYKEVKNYDQALAALEKALYYNQQLIEISSNSAGINSESNKAAFEDLWVTYSAIGSIFEAQGMYREALETYQKSLEAAQQINDLSAKASVLGVIGAMHKRLGQYSEALSTFQQLSEMELPEYGFTGLISIANIYRELGRYTEAIATNEKALTIVRDRRELLRELVILNNLGTVYVAQGRYNEAWNNFDIALKLSREVRSRIEETQTYRQVADLCSHRNNPNFIEEQEQNISAALSEYHQELSQMLTENSQKGCADLTWTLEATTLNNIAFLYDNQGQYQKSIQLYQQATNIIETYLENPLDKALYTANIGGLYWRQGEYNTALEYYERALEIYQRVDSKDGVASVLAQIGNVYIDQGQYAEGLKYQEQALLAVQEMGLRPRESNILSSIAFVYQAQGNYEEAEEYYESAIELDRSLGVRVNEARKIRNLGKLYFERGQYDQAQNFAQQAFAVYDETDSNPDAGEALADIGIYQRAQGNYAEALASQQQALSIAEEISDRDNTADALNALGTTYTQLGQYDKALDYQQRSLAIYQEIGARNGAAIALNSIGLIYEKQGQFDQALEAYQQALAIHRDIGSVAGESQNLQAIGFLYEKLGEDRQAQRTFEAALDIQQRIGAKGLEATTLNGLALAIAGSGQTEEALTLLQRSLSTHQELGDPFSQAQVLSDIGKLLSQQAQPELAIVFLKQSINLTETLRAELEGLPTDEQQSFADAVSDRYRLLAELLLQQDRILEAQEVLDLLKLQELENYLRDVQRSAEPDGLSYWPAEQAILDLYSPDTDLNAFMQSPKVQAQVDQLRRNARGQNLNPQQLAALQDNLQQLGNAALLYPLILDNRLELILVTPSGLVRETVAVDRVELNRLITDFRRDITNRARDPQPNAQQLYEWLIAPLADTLAEAQTDTILYAADGQLRYIPLSALHDGQQWLVQRFTINHITAASLTNFSPTPDTNLSVLAGAFPAEDQSVTVEDETVTFSGLPFAQAEVQGIAATVDETTALLSQAFNREAVEPYLDNYRVIHFATHAEFVSGSPLDSFILFGDGDRLTLSDVDEWRLPNVDLVVLSACKTAVSTNGLGNGEEILGFGYQIQRTGAEAAIASLWYVSDGGTQVLMNAFYAGLEQGLSTAAALQQAQTALIEGDFSAYGAERATIIVQQRDRLSPNVASRLNHPYFWAPFILIGNGV